MDDVQRPAEAGGPAAPPAPPGFFPLRLVLQPSGLVLDVDRPDMIAGRHTSADLRLPLPDVSRRHCRFLFEEGRWFVLDLGSLNGLWVNDERVERASLEQGDLVRIGAFRFAADLTRSAPAAEERPDVLRSILKAMPPRGRGSDHLRKAS
jgi:pSer/pThr/pTyr-binding forkhead associated (FHA) protein